MAQTANRRPSGRLFCLRARGSAGEGLGNRVIERWQIVRRARGDQGPAIGLALLDRLIHPTGGTGIFQVDAYAFVGGEGLAFDHACVDQGPWAVADRGDSFAGISEFFDQAQRGRVLA